MDFYEKLRQLLSQRLDKYTSGKVIGDTEEMERAKAHLEQRMYSKKKAKDELAKAYSSAWTDWKNNAINGLYGKEGVSFQAKLGKMFDDDGNIIDIDYDYYSTVPYSTLERVFGDGAKDVRKVINDREKVRKGGITDADIDIKYYSQLPRGMVERVFGESAPYVNRMIDYATIKNRNM